MSDQTPSLSNLGNVDGRNLINVGGSGTLVSINGDNTPAQVLVGVGNCIVTDMGGGVHNINVPIPVTTFLTDINADTTASQTLAAGAGITIVDGGGGLHTISATLAAAVTSINGDTTAAQVIDAGTGISVTDLGNTHTIVNTAPALPLQVAQTISGGDVIPSGVPTAICSVVVPASGFYQVSANVKFTTLPATPVDYSIEIQDDFAVSIVASQGLETSGGLSIVGQLNCSTAVQATVGVGHTFSIIVTHGSPIALTTTADILTSLTLQFLGV